MNKNKSNRSHLTFFNEFGRLIPRIPGPKSRAFSRRRYIIEQPELKYSEIYERIKNFLGTDQISLNEFEEKIDKTINIIKKDNGIKNILNGVVVPFILPKISNFKDIGIELENTFLPAVKRSFNKYFPNYDFTNHYKSSLAGVLNIEPGSRNEEILNRVQNETLVGLLFPCITDFSHESTISNISFLPKKLILAGGFEVCSSIVGSPNLLYRHSGYPPLLWLSGLSTGKAGVGYHFESYGYNLTFNRRPHLDKVSEYWCSSLVYLS